MEIGDVVVRKSYGKDITFKIIDIRDDNHEFKYLLKGINIRILADSIEEDLIKVNEEYFGQKDEIFNRKVNNTIKKILSGRPELKRQISVPLRVQDTKDLYFGRPGKILHIDADSDYMEVCSKVYKQLNLYAITALIPENEQPLKCLDLVKKYKPDIVVLTGHDSILKNVNDYKNLDNYRNSKYFGEATSILRNYEKNYDDLVIFAGACQSYYEHILDCGANFASSPNRVLIHCLDPVFICEKIAYTNIENFLSTEEILSNTITGSNGIGGLQTRGRLRKGFPKSMF